MSKITVFVPIYNVEKYLKKCFDSLVKQTFDDYVIFAINDGSPDNSQSIIDEYTEKYPNKIIGITKENGGYGSVLELAIKKCESEFFLVCDPDDYLEDDALEHLYGLASLSNADITIGAKYFIYGDGDETKYDAAYNTNFVTLKKDTVYNANSKDFDDLFFIDPSPHSKLYRTENAKKIVFPHKVGYTDNLLFYISLLSANKVIYTNKACAYYLVDRPGNTMTDISPKAIDAHISVFKTVIDQAEGLNHYDMFYYRMFEGYKFILYQSRRMKGTKQEYKERLDNLYGIIEKLIPYKTEIVTNYNKYSKNGLLEKYRDKQLLNKNSSKNTYKKIEKKMIEEFVEK